MLFCTLEYLAFLLLVVLVYWRLPDGRARVWWLLGVSIAFYASWNKQLAGLITVTTWIDYKLALRMEAATSPRRRKAFLTFSILMNLSLLAYFKYANFFLDSLRDSLALVGAEVSFPVLSVILPIGISFYTFEAINYMVDVHRGKLPAERNLGHFMLFILFFPHLIAGPIVRARDFLPQVGRPHRWSWHRANLGLWLIVLGWCKKSLVADRMALVVDPVFADPGSYGTLALWLAAFGFVLQVYCDFSGYTDMALGSAHLLGYRLAINFRLPLLAASIGEFWRRWHISLSEWLRDYLFIPLGGSHHGEWRTRLNLLVTMTLGGLWHGAGWNFVLFGVSQGTLLGAHRAWARGTRRSAVWQWFAGSFLGHAALVLLTLTVFTLCLVIFRTSGPGDAWRMFERMFQPSPGTVAPLALSTYLGVLALVVAGHAWAVLGPTDRILRRWPGWLQGTILGLGLTAAMLMAPGRSRAFIYFQF